MNTGSAMIDQRGTPILDRRTPLPQRSAPGSGLSVLLTIWMVAVVLTAVGVAIFLPPTLREQFLTEVRSWLLNQKGEIGVGGIAVSVIAAFYLMVAIHELGHVVAGLIVGFRFRAWRVGPLVISNPFRISFYRGPGALVNGEAELIPVGFENLRWRGVTMVLGGPLSNFLSALILWALPLPLTIFSASFIAFSVVNGANDLFPLESRLGVSDGRRIGMLLRDGWRGERWLALLHLGGELNNGVLPELLGADFLAKAVAERDESADTVIAHGIAFSAAFHQHDDEIAAQRLETCLAYSGSASPLLREALMSDAAVFQGRRRKRADLAAQWLAELQTSQQQWFRTRAEAAVLEAEGDIAGALSKLAEVEKEIQAFPTPAQRTSLLTLLERWKIDLRSR